MPAAHSVSFPSCGGPTDWKGDPLRFRTDGSVTVGARGIEAVAIA